MFRRLCEDLHSSLGSAVSGFSELISTLTETGQSRNSVVHADWDNTDHDGYTFVGTKAAQGVMRQEYVQFSPESLEGLIEKILAGRRQLEAYWERRTELLYGTHCHELPRDA